MMQKLVKKKTTFRFLVVLLISLFFESPVIWNFFSSFKSWPDILTRRLLLFHILAALCWLFYEKWTLKSFFSINRYWSRLYTFFILCFPVFGYAIVVGIFFASQSSHKSIGEIEEDILPDTTEKETFYLPLSKKEQRDKVLSELDFIPLVEIMEGSDIQLKRGAIERLADLKSSEAIAILLKYRNDDSSEIRFYVTSSLVKIKADYEEQLDAAKKEMQQDINKISARVFLARIYMNYAICGLLDVATKKTYLKEAIYHLTFSINSPYDKDDAYLLLSEIYLANEDWESLDQLFETMIQKKGQLSEALLKQQIVSSFNRGHFKSLVNSLKNLKNSDCSDKNWAALTAWWGIS